VQPRVVKAPCETCAYKNSVNCYNVKALLKTVCAMEMELYNHGVENLVEKFVLPCKNYVPESKLLQQKYRKVV